MLEDEGFNVLEDPPTVVFEAALLKYRNDAELKAVIARVEKEYEKIFNKYRQKMQTNKITDEELNELEEELIFSNSL